MKPISKLWLRFRALGLLSLLTVGSAVPALSAALQLYGPSPNSPFTVGTGPAGIWLGNLRGDGNMRDIVTANSVDGTISVSLFLGEGNFGSAGLYPVGNNPQGVRTADFNRDGFEDIAVVNYNDGTVSVLMNLGGGVLFAPRTDYAVGAGPKAITVADVNRDGFLDLLVANYGGNSISVVPGRSGGLFDGGNVGTYAVGTGPNSICVGDFNGDGHLDMLTADELAGTLSLLPGRGDGTFDTAVVVMSDPTYQPAYALPGYLDGDAILDLAVTLYNATNDTGIVRVLKGQAGGTFVAGSIYGVGTHPQSLLVLDLNRDGIPDLAVANSGDDNVEVLLGAGDGTFASQGTFVVGDKPTIVVGGNFNEDRATDLAVVNTGDVTPGSTVSVLMYTAPLADNMPVTGFEDTPLSISLSGRVFGGIPEDLDYFIFDTNGVVIGPGGGPTRYGWLQQTGRTRSVTYTPGLDKYVPNPDDPQRDSFAYYTRDRLGTLESLPATCKITVIPVNDPPGFDFNPVYWNSSSNRFEVALMEDAPATTFPGFAVNIGPGGWKENRQSLTFLVAAQDPAFFVSKPKINSATGALTFRPARDRTSLGGVKVTVRLRDNAGTANGGISTNPPPPAVPEEFYVVVNPNPLKPIKGRYSGLFYQVDGDGVPIVSHQSSGFFTFNMVASGTSANGVFSGKLTGEGGTYGFAGQFDQAGHALIPVYPPNNSTLFLDLNLDVLDPGANRVSGSVTAEGNAWMANHLEGYRAPFTSASPAPWLGRYTLVYPGAHGAAASFPGGDGYGTLLVTSAGMVRASGRLGDGTSFSQSAGLSPDGRWPFYALLYHGRGSALGWLKFSSPSNRLELVAANRPLNWTKPVSADRLYPAGFAMQLSPIASLYTPPTLPGAPLYPGEDIAGQLAFQDGNLSQAEQYAATFTQENTVTVGVMSYLRLSSPATGLMTGQFFHQNLALNRSIRGVVLQDQRSVRGYFMGADQTGSAIFQP